MRHRFSKDVGEVSGGLKGRGSRFWYEFSKAIPNALYTCIYIYIYIKAKHKPPRTS